MSTAKRNALLLLAIGTLLTLILAMSLSRIELDPGKPLPLGQPQVQLPGSFGALPGGDVLISVVQGIIAVAIILSPVAIIYSLMTPQGRRRLVVYIVVVALLFLLADYLRNHVVRPDQSQSQQAGQVTNARTGNPSDTDLLARIPTTPPAWLVVAIILVASVFAALIIYGIYSGLRRREIPVDDAIEELAQEAQKAIETLHSGGELNHTIIHCYQEMSRVVEKSQGVSRDRAMTPHEFEARLVSQGLPREAVGTLTRLFEQVRYGGVTPGSRQEDQALACLADIVSACQKRGKLA